MSEEQKESLIVAAVITSIIAILTIVFGNTGSGFFRNLIIFIVGTIIGTPIAIIIKWSVSIFTENELYKYGGFVIGAILGVGIASMIFSNKLETSFVYQCVRGWGLNKSQCECVYEEIDDKYSDNLNGSITTKQQKFISQAIKKCQ